MEKTTHSVLNQRLQQGLEESWVNVVAWSFGSEQMILAKRGCHQISSVLQFFSGRRTTLRKKTIRVQLKICEMNDRSICVKPTLHG